MPTLPAKKLGFSSIYADNDEFLDLFYGLKGTLLTKKPGF